MVSPDKRKEVLEAMIGSLLAAPAHLTAQARKELVDRFGEAFESKFRPSFDRGFGKIEDAKVKRVSKVLSVYERYLKWLRMFLEDLELEPNVTRDRAIGTVRFDSCAWSSLDIPNDLLCPICLEMVSRTFAWAGLKGSVYMVSCKAKGSPACELEIVLHLLN